MWPKLTGRTVWGCTTCTNAKSKREENVREARGAGREKKEGRGKWAKKGRASLMEIKSGSSRVVIKITEFGQTTRYDSMTHTSILPTICPYSAMPNRLFYLYWKKGHSISYKASHWLGNGGSVTEQKYQDCHIHRNKLCLPTVAFWEIIIPSPQPDSVLSLTRLIC